MRRVVAVDRIRPWMAGALAAVGGGRVSLQRLIDLLFGNDEQGAFYVPRPQLLGQQVLFQDAAGTTPVESDGDPVGLMLDLSQGLELGPELPVSLASPVVQNSGGSAGFWDDATQTFGNTEASSSQSYPRIFFPVSGVELNTTYKIELELSGDVDKISSLRVRNSAGDFFTFSPPIGSIFTCISTLQIGANSSIQFFMNGEVGSVSVERLSIQELPGNHAFQEVSGSRPVYRTDGSKHWLAFDGVSSYMKYDRSPLQSVCIAGNFLDSDIDGVLGTNGARHYIAIRKDTGRVRYRGDDSDTVLALAPWAGTSVVSGILDPSGIFTAWRGSDTGSVEGKSVIQVDRIARRHERRTEMDLNGAITSDAVWATEQREAAEKYLANLAGVTLP